MYHLLSIEYKAVIDGKTKTVTESFLVEATGLGEVEKIIAQIFKTRIRNAQWHTITQLRTLDDVIFHSGTARSENEADPFYQVKAKFFDESYEVYVPAEHADQAIERFLEYYPSLVPKYITLIKATNILGVWDPTSELWQGDFHNRSEILYDAGRGNYDRNQLEIEGTQGGTSDEFKSAMEAGGVDRVSVEHNGETTVVYDRNDPEHVQDKYAERRDQLAKDVDELAKSESKASGKGSNQFPTGNERNRKQAA